MYGTVLVQPLLAQIISRKGKMCFFTSMYISKSLILSIMWKKNNQTNMKITLSKVVLKTKKVRFPSMIWQALTRYASVWTKHSRSLLYVDQPQLFGLYVRMTGSILLGPFCSWGHVCFIYNAWPGTYKVKKPPVYGICYL